MAPKSKGTLSEPVAVPEYSPRVGGASLVLAQIKLPGVAKRKRISTNNGIPVGHSHTNYQLQQSVHIIGKSEMELIERDTTTQINHLCWPHHIIFELFSGSENSWWTTQLVALPSKVDIIQESRS